MFLSRILRRPLFAAVNSEASATATSATTIRSPLEDFFEADRSLGDEKPNVYGRGWKASELRLKSWDDLQKLWYVLLKEKNMLLSQRQMMNSQNLRFPNPERLPKPDSRIFSEVKSINTLGVRGLPLHNTNFIRLWCQV